MFATDQTSSVPNAVVAGEAASFRTHQVRPDTIIAHRNAAERAIKEMWGRLDEPIRLEHLARSAILSPFHFNRTFRQITGIPPTRFLYAARIQRAKRLILTSSRSILEICYDVGYNSLGTFTTRFTQVVGVSPTRLRKMAQTMTAGTLWAMCVEFEKRLTTRGPADADPCSGRVLRGQITSLVPCAGPVFLGLFRKPIPEGRPIVGTILGHTGPFEMSMVPVGSYYLLAAGIRCPEDVGSYLLLDEALVAAAGPIDFGQNEQVVDVTMVLRERSPTDPPILISLPVLLGENPPVPSLCV